MAVLFIVNHIQPAIKAAILLRVLESICHSNTMFTILKNTGYLKY